MDLLLPEIGGLPPNQLLRFVALVLDQLVVGEAHLTALPDEIRHGLLALVHQIVDLYEGLGGELRRGRSPLVDNG